MTKFLPSSIKSLALHQYQVQDQNWSERGNKFLIKVMLRLFYLIITIWALFALCLLVSLISRCQPWPQDKVTLLQISWHHNLTTNNIPSLALFCLTDYCKVFRIAKCSQQCLIFESRPGEEWPSRSSPNYPDSWEMQPSDQAKMPGWCSVNKLLISASSNAVFAGVGPWLSL